jgi:hypothetical protein
MFVPSFCVALALLYCTLHAKVEVIDFLDIAPHARFAALPKGLFSMMEMQNNGVIKWAHLP